MKSAVTCLVCDSYTVGDRFLMGGQFLNAAHLIATIFEKKVGAIHLMILLLLACGGFAACVDLRL